MIIKDNCFAMKNNQCSILLKTDCVSCKFYKTKEQAREDKRKAADRLERLGLCPIEGVINGVRCVTVSSKFTYSA